MRINGRTRLLEPAAIDLIIKVLQILFAPFVLVPVLLVVAFVHGWLYLVHGVSGALRDVHYAPASRLLFSVSCLLPVCSTILGMLRCCDTEAVRLRVWVLASTWYTLRSIRTLLARPMG
jgi:hypothetical protein